jgi:PAS domain S-box-containing protein
MSPEQICDPTESTSARIWVGPRDVIEEADTVACELLGYTRADLVGIHGSELVPLEDHASTAASLDRMRLGEVIRRNGHVLHSDGTVLAVEVTARVLPDARLLLSLRKTTE